ncbi:MAG: hypothetical protein JST20_01875 [Bacteroidetes bacterium]|nr:hypothetical protein [Bacteroidota bacterium]
MILGRNNSPKSKNSVHLIASVFLTITIATVFIACSHTKSMTGGRDISNDTLMLQRTVCFGMCPSYKLIIYGTGKVEYEGFKYSKIDGKVSAEIPVDSVRILIQEIEKADFFSWNDEYQRQDATDLPSAWTTVTIDGNTKLIKHYGGDSSAPRKLTEIEHRIDEIANSEQWIR